MSTPDATPTTPALPIDPDGLQDPAQDPEETRVREAAQIADRTQRLQDAGITAADAHLLACDALVDIDMLEQLRAQGAAPVAALQGARQHALVQLQERFALLAWARVPLAMQAHVAGDARYDLDQMADHITHGCDPLVALRIIAPANDPWLDAMEAAHGVPGPGEDDGAGRGQDDGDDTEGA